MSKESPVNTATQNIAPTTPPVTGGDSEAEGYARYRYSSSFAGAIERRWQEYWQTEQTFHTPNPGEQGFVAERSKQFILDMFPYPSGVGLHVGHPLGYIATDIFSRFLRMKGHNVLHAMGYDAFGLPAEQYAIQTGQHPRITTENNIATMREQMRRLGLGHDPKRTFATTDVNYYKWTQWIFLQIFNSWYDPEQNKARPIKELIKSFESGEKDVSHPKFNPSGEEWSQLDEGTRADIINDYRLAYVDELPVNWCPGLGTVLANEEVTAEGRSERGNFPVYKRPLKQWIMRITAYCERLLRGLEDLNWPEPIKLMQRNWIGRSEGAEVDFLALRSPDEDYSEWFAKRCEQGWTDGTPPESLAVRVFTTRPDTLFGATYMVLAPEHPLVDELTADVWPDNICEQWKGVFPGKPEHELTPKEAVAAYRNYAQSKTDVERQEESREKTGVFIGAYAVNPVNRNIIPVFIADYVLMGYGTGAIMAVPAHDERDFEFARQFELPIQDVVYTRLHEAIRQGCEKILQSDIPADDWLRFLADFVGLCMNQNRNDYDKIAQIVINRRQNEFENNPLQTDIAPAEKAEERRGSVALTWFNALQELQKSGTDNVKTFVDKAAHGRLMDAMGQAGTDPGFAANSANEEFSINGLASDEAKQRISLYLEEKGLGKRAINYRLRDWLFSRQRYWGEPFPIVYDETGRPHALDESQLPVELPELDDFAPQTSDDPNAPLRTPLSRAEDWVKVEIDGKVFTRELSTMPNWAGSCWYYLRYLDPENNERFVGRDAERYWMLSPKNTGSAVENYDPEKCNPGGVDLYVGGVEHAVLHLLYARFWHMILFDLGHVSTPEPFHKLFNQGYVQAYAYTDDRGMYVNAHEVEERDGKYYYHDKEVKRQYGKMGKSLKNAVSPDEICEEYGADTLRLYEMYMGPLEASKPWNTRDIVGVHRFLQRFWRVLIDEQTGELKVTDEKPADDLRKALHKTIHGVKSDMQSLCFNTAIAKLIELNNRLTRLDKTPREVAEAMVKMLAPLAPHIAEELWLRLGHQPSVAYEAYPEADDKLLVADMVEIPVMVKGKVRARIQVPADADPETLETTAMNDETVKRYLSDKQVRKVIVVPGRMINIVV